LRTGQEREQLWAIHATIFHQRLCAPRHWPLNAAPRAR
jgi:hypothetical protein